MTIILSRNFSLCISLINQDKGRHTSGRRPSEWLKLRVARTGLIVQSVAKRSTLKGRTHFRDVFSTDLCTLSAPVQFSSREKKKKEKKKRITNHKKGEQKTAMKADLYWNINSFLCLLRGLHAGEWRIGLWMWGTGMLICEIMAFLGRIANSNMCHFVKRTAVVTADTVSRGLPRSLSVRNNGCQV